MSGITPVTNQPANAISAAKDAPRNIATTVAESVIGKSKEEQKSPSLQVRAKLKEFYETKRNEFETRTPVDENTPMNEISARVKATIISNLSAIQEGLDTIRDLLNHGVSKDELNFNKYIFVTTVMKEGSLIDLLDQIKNLRKFSQFDKKLNILEERVNQYLTYGLILQNARKEITLNKYDS